MGVMSLKPPAVRHRRAFELNPTTASANSSSTQSLRIPRWEMVLTELSMPLPWMQLETHILLPRMEAAA